MKQLIFIAFVTIFLSSCYDDYVQDYKYSSVYFTYQHNVRTFIVGEGMKFDFGVGLGGVTDNTKERIVDFVIDPDLVTPQALATMKASSLTYIKNATTPVTAFSLLPSNLYTLTDNSKFVIHNGQHSGRVTIKADSAAFLANANTLIPNYVLPLKIISSSAGDSVLATKNTSIIAVKYENMLFGNYWHGGKIIRYNPENVVRDTIKYYTTIPQTESKVRVLRTIAPFELTINGYANVTSTKPELKLKLNSDGSIELDRATGSTFAFQAEGTSTFNKAKLLQNRKIYLKYKYTDNQGNLCIATDTLTFRNRIRDGVNEWQDENPENYK